MVSIANLPTTDQLNAEIAKRSHLEFMRLTWQQQKPFIVGHHTKEVCDAIDRAIKRYREGISTFLVINIPFRHGKSDLISRYLPARFKALFPDEDILLAAYNTTFAMGFSKATQNIIRSDKYQRLFPHVKINQKASKEKWFTNDGNKEHNGEYNCAGMLAGLTGLGYSLGVVDDPIKNREEAESETIREKIWEEFKDSFMTRRAPVSMTIVCNTPWHIDDLNGRIKSLQKDTPDFPEFEFIVLPAKSEKYDTGFLFPERFSPEWYKGQFAALGSYSSAGLLQCNPVARGGRIICTDNIQYYEGEPPKGLKFIRAWDLALSEKQRVKDDPDYTVGIKMSVYREKHFNSFMLDHLYIEDVIRGRWSTTNRDKKIIDVAIHEENEIFAEYTGLFKDSFSHLKDILRGHRKIGKVAPNKDLLIRAAAIEPIFEAGNVYLKKADWNSEFLRELAAFPGDKHDDQLAALVTGYEAMKKGGGVYFLGDVE